MLKLFIIDDDPLSRMLIREMLIDTDIVIIESDCGTKALDIFARHSKEIGLILLDIKLPDCDGWILSADIREVDPEIPIIATSALTPNELEGKYREALLTGYITKPFDMNRLREIIQCYLHIEFDWNSKQHSNF